MPDIQVHAFLAPGPLAMALASAVRMYASVKALPGQPYAAHLQKLVVTLAAKDVLEAIRIHGLESLGGIQGAVHFGAGETSLKRHYGELGQLIGTVTVEAARPIFMQSRRAA